MKLILRRISAARYIPSNPAYPGRHRDTGRMTQAGKPIPPYPKNPRSRCATSFAAALSNRPSRRSIRPGSMQAILAGRTTEGAGNTLSAAQELARLSSALKAVVDAANLKK